MPYSERPRRPGPAIRQAVDPLNQLLAMSTPKEPELEDLRPYLKGWSPYGPEANGFGWGAR